MIHLIFFQSKPIKGNVNTKIEDEIWELILKLDLDLMIEYSPSDLNILIDDLHSINEEIHSLLVQSTLTSVDGSKIISLSKRGEDVLQDFIKTIITSDINFPVKIGNSVDSSELKLAFAQTIVNLYNVYFIDSRKINSFYSDIIENHLFGTGSQSINFEEFMERDVLLGK